jgi:hypothetical protein
LQSGQWSISISLNFFSLRATLQRGQFNLIPHSGKFIARVFVVFGVLRQDSISAILE